MESVATRSFGEVWEGRFDFNYDVGVSSTINCSERRVNDSLVMFFQRIMDPNFSSVTTIPVPVAAPPIFSIRRHKLKVVPRRTLVPRLSVGKGHLKLSILMGASVVTPLSLPPSRHRMPLKVHKLAIYRQLLGPGPIFLETNGWMIWTSESHLPNREAAHSNCPVEYSPVNSS